MDIGLLIGLGVSAALIAYLVVAMVRPEWFWG